MIVSAADAVAGPSTAASAVMVGSTLGTYRLTRKLGEGGMGEVYLAQHVRLDRRAAIKVLLPAHSSNAEAVARFFAEARAASIIHHPAIVEVLDCDVHASGRAYIVMEHLDGQTLAQVLARGGRLAQEPHTAIAIAAEIASGLAAAHARGVVHRDIKPENVLIARSPLDGALRVKVLDFGIAKLTTELHDVLSKTKSGFFLGTPFYMSPEQCRAAGRVDSRTDVYSLGSILFEMLAGRPPFVKDNFGDLLAAQLLEPPPRLAELEPSVSPELDALVDRMLAKDPAARPQTMGEVLTVLNEHLGTPPPSLSELLAQSEVLARAEERRRDADEAAEQVAGPIGAATTGRAGPGTVELADSAIAPVSRTVPPAKTSRLAIALGTGVAIVVAIVVGTSVHRERRPSPPPNASPPSVTVQPEAAPAAPAAPAAAAPALPPTGVVDPPRARAAAAAPARNRRAAPPRHAPEPVAVPAAPTPEPRAPRSEFKMVDD